VEVVTCHVDGGHLVIGNGDALRIRIGVEFTINLQASVGGGGADQVHNDPIADQRLGPPVDADE
jgi:hypothetical protein